MRDLLFCMWRCCCVAIEVMEYCNAGDLRKAIKEKVKCQENFPESQLCLALQYIHAEKVLHRIGRSEPPSPSVQSAVLFSQLPK
eukprot:5174404-Amphidinium_carterae.1